MQHVNFDIIRYANCWEDADVLLNALALPPNSSVMCIASAGDNALALLSTSPAEVYANDISTVQLYLAELKQMAFAILDYNEVLQLLGVADVSASLRINLYRHIAWKLSPGARHYWNENASVIERGVIYSGKFEQYFIKFRKHFLPLVHTGKTIRQLLHAKNEKEQEVFYNAKWNTWRWKLLMQFFFSKHVMGKYGRDPEFLQHIDIPVAQYIRLKAEQHLRSTAATENYFLHMILTGSFGGNLPFYLREKNFNGIRNNIHKLTLVHAKAEELVRHKTFDACCLSNIFEYMSEREFYTLTEAWQSYINKGCRLAFWNLMARRSFSEIRPEAFRHDPLSNVLSLTDRGFFYSRFILEERI